MSGLHLTADLYRCRCDAAWLADAHRLGEWCAQAARSVGLQPLHHAFHAAGGGVSGAVVLAGAHVAVHTRAAARTATLDVLVGEGAAEEGAQARILMTAMVERFQPEWTEQRSLDRGGDDT